MHTFQAAEAGESFLRVLDEVRHGETVLIEIDGKTVARLGLDRGNLAKGDADQERVDQAVANILALRKQIAPISTEEILSARDEGRR